MKLIHEMNLTTHERKQIYNSKSRIKWSKKTFSCCSLSYASNRKKTIRNIIIQSSFVMFQKKQFFAKWFIKIEKKSLMFVKWTLTMMIVVDSTQIFLHQFSDKASRRDKNISSVIYWIDEKRSINSVIYWIDEKKNINSMIYWIDEKKSINSVIYWIDEKKKHQFNDISNWREKTLISTILMKKKRRR
jgi:hypothetical protein